MQVILKQHAEFGHITSVKSLMKHHDDLSIPQIRNKLYWQNT